MALAGGWGSTALAALVGPLTLMVGSQQKQSAMALSQGEQHRACYLTTEKSALWH